MEKFILPNGLTVILEKRPTNTIVALATVKVGSNDETEKNNGISHFVEHAVFNGTTSRTALEISNEIEVLGGELNAGTTPEKTFFFTKTLPKHLDKSLSVLSDILFNPTFKEEHLKTEKGVVVEEISFVYDDLNFFQWVIFQGNLFNGPQRRPVYGSKENVLGLSQATIKEFHNKYYQPKNMILTLVGDLPVSVKLLISKHFSVPKGEEITRELPNEADQEHKEFTKHMPSQSSYMVLGYKVPPRGHPDSIIFDIINGVLGRGQSGKLFDKIRNQLGLAYSVGSYHYQGYLYNFFAMYANLQEQNIKQVKATFLEELRALENIDEKTLNESKTFIEGDFYVRNEDNTSWAHSLTQWELAKGDYKEFLEAVKNVTVEEVRDKIKKYFKEFTVTIIAPENKQ